MTTQSPVKKLGLLSEPQLLLYLFGQLISLTGTLLQGAVLSLLVVSLTDKSEAGHHVALIMVLRLAPGMLLNPLAGALLDRWNKQKTLIATGLVSALLTWYLAHQIDLGEITILKIYVVSLIDGFVGALDSPGRNAMIREVVKDKKNFVRSASKMFSSLYNLAQIAGPGFAGVLIAKFGYSATLLLNTYSCVVLVGVLLRVKTFTSHRPNTSTPIWTQALEGCKFAFNHQQIFLSTSLSVVICSLGYSLNVMLPVVNKYMLHGDDPSFSRLAAGNGTGSFIGILMSFALAKRKWTHKAISTLGVSVTGIMFLLLSQTTNMNLALIEVTLSGASFMLAFTTIRACIPHFAGDSKVGIVMGVSMSFFYAGMLISSVGSGKLIDTLGCSTTLATTAIALLVTAVSIPFIPGIDELDK